MKFGFTSVGNSTISNWLAKSGRSPLTRATTAPPDISKLIIKGRFSFKLSMNGWP